MDDERGEDFRRVKRDGGGWLEHLPIAVAEEPRIFSPDGSRVYKRLSHDLVAVIDAFGHPVSLTVRKREDRS